MIELIAEILFEFVGEFILETIGEILFEFGFSGAAEKITVRRGGAGLISLFYAAFGAILGAVSLLFFPRIEFTNILIPLIYFIASPIAGGFAVTTVSWLMNRDLMQTKWLRFDKFFCGAMLAVSYSLVRFIFG